MDILHDIPLSALQFYLTAPYKCSYLEGREARSQVATPSFLVTSKIYSELVRRGFRRSGSFTYRPNCDACRACVPVRIPVNEFVPNRSQRRAARHHNGLEILLHGMKDNAEHFDLYRRYQKTRHRDDSMDSDDPVQYRNFLLQSHVDSTLVEFRDHGRLCMVSLIDILDDGLSSVYTFYDPATQGASFGTYNVLWQIELCRKLELDYLYLGYWIKESRKMAYKANFTPLQGLVDGEWKVLNGERA
jgi:leucyl-tRNA---protein transferase